MRYGQDSQAKKIGILSKDSGSARNTVSIQNPMSTLSMALPYIILTVAEMDPKGGIKRPQRRKWVAVKEFYLSFNKLTWIPKAG